MRLSSLKPKWITLANWAAPELFAIGVRFQCPHCGGRLAVTFWPPVDPFGMMGRVFDPLPDNGGHRRESGDSFDTLTLKPSIGIDREGCSFHGHIINGEVTL